MKEKLRQDSIQWEKQLAAVTIKGNPLTIPPEERWNRGSHLGTSLEKEPTATEVLAKLPGMFKNKDGKPQAFIGGAPEIYINDRKVQDYSVVENLPVTTDKRGEGDSSSRSRIRQQRGLRAAHHHQEEPARTRHRGELRRPLRLLREQQPRPRPYLHPRQNDLLRQTGLRQLAGYIGKNRTSPRIT